MNGTPSFFRVALKSFWLLFGGIWFFVGGIFAVVGGGMVWSDWRYRVDGETAEARVVENHTERGSKGSTRYLLAYEFRTRAGERISGRASVSREAWEGAAEQGRVTVEYLPGQPATNRVRGSGDQTLALIFGGVGLVFGGIGGFLFFRALSRVRTVLRILREGIRTDGSVAEVRETSISINRVRQWCIRYTYTDYTGRVHEAESDYMSPGEAQTWGVGDAGTVRYDQQRPDLSAWVGRDTA